MFHISPLLNILYKLTRNSGKNILRDFTEIERLQSSVKDSHEYVKKALRNLFKNIEENLSKIKKEIEVIDINKESQSTCWLVSSVDSVLNFSRGIPEFMITIGYKENNKITDCIFYNPINDEAFFFGLGAGGSKNDFKLRVSEKKKISESLISINYSSIPEKELNFLNNLNFIFQQKEINFRTNNSLFYELSLLTEGKIDALLFYNSSQNIKDIFNFTLKETGGFLIDNLNNRKNLYLASNKYIGKSIEEMIEK